MEKTVLYWVKGLKDYQSLIVGVIAALSTVVTLAVGILQYRDLQTSRLHNEQREAFLRRHLDGGVYPLIDSITYQGVLTINVFLRLRLTKNENPEALPQVYKELRSSPSIQALLNADFPEANKALARLDFAYTPLYYVVVNSMVFTSQVARELFVVEDGPSEKGNPEQVVNNMYLFVTSVLGEVAAIIRETDIFDSDRHWLLDNPRYLPVYRACEQFRDLHRRFQQAKSEDKASTLNDLNNFMVSYRQELIGRDKLGLSD